MASGGSALTGWRMLLKPLSMSQMRSDLSYFTELINPTVRGIYIKMLACGSETEF